MSKLKLGIIGVGSMGGGYVQAMPLANCELSAICDTSAEALAKFKDLPVAKFTNSVDLLDSGLVEAVIVVTPHYFHVPIALQAIDRGIHVLVDKPIAVQKSEAVKLVEACRQHPELVVSAMFCQRRMPEYIKLKKLLDSGELGRIQRINWIITDWFRTQYYYDNGDWRASWAGEGGGVLLNQCPHQLDLMQWFFGMPNRITAVMSFGKYHNIEVEDEVSSIWEYADGKTAVFVTSTGEAPGTNRLEVTGDRGKVVLEGNKLTYIRNEIGAAEYCRTSKERMTPPEVWNIEIPFDTKVPPVHSQIIENFVDAIQNGTELYAPAVEGINSLELANGMLLSGQLGKSVKLPIDCDEFDKMLNELKQNSRYNQTK